MTRFTSSARSDVGRVRKANEDSYWQGDSVFAVADGMGGHAAGEVASSKALEPIGRLDGRVFADAQEAVAMLRDAVVEANRAVVTLAAGDPDLRGMGTTLTAAMVEGRRLHVAHVGDSRCYLLRDGGFSQLTTDHTLVQHLIDEGQITEEEAATHPQRSIITRAIGVNRDIDVDTLTLDLLEGDQILLCSDGLTGTVDDETIGEVLGDAPDADVAVGALIDLANDAGGPDNITVVLLRADPDDAPRPPRVISTRPTDAPSDDRWADRLSRFGGSARQPAQDRAAPVGPSRTQRVGAILAALALLAAIGVGGGRWLLGRSYFVWAQEDAIAIYQGVPSSVGPVDLYWIAERTPYTLDDVPSFRQPALREGIPATDLADARRIARSQLREDAGDGTSP